MFTVRDPRAAGLFYNSDKPGLVGDIESFYNCKDGPGDAEPEKMRALITPHNKYHLCGQVCAWSFSRLDRTNYVIIGPNHHGIGSRFAVMREGLWKTPLGEVVISNKLAQRMLDRSSLLQFDVIPHNSEHSVEVQLPFLQHRFGNDFKIVPIVVANKFEDEEFVEQCRSLGKSIAQCVMSDKEKWTVIATTDLSKGRRDEIEKVDKKIMAAASSLSEKKLYSVVHRNASYICGYGALLTALAASKALGARKGKQLKYASSKEELDNPKSFVGYASMLLK